MLGINRITLLGYLGNDPEIRKTKFDSKYAFFSVATSEFWKDKETDEKKTKTEWHRVVVLNKHIAEVCEKYLHKGSKVYIEGKMQTRRFQDKTGIERSVSEVVINNLNGMVSMLDTLEKAEETNYDKVTIIERDVTDDDIPF